MYDKDLGVVNAVVEASMRDKSYNVLVNCTEIAVTADALFGGGLTNVIVQECEGLGQICHGSGARGSQEDHSCLQPYRGSVVLLGRGEGLSFDGPTPLRGRIRQGAGKTGGVVLPLRSPFGVGEDGHFEAVGAEVPRPSLSHQDRPRGKAGAPGPGAPGTQTPQQLQA